MLPILKLNNKLEVTASGKAYVVDFLNRRDNSQIRTWVAISQSKIEDGQLWVADWLLEPNRGGIESLIRAGHTCLNGVVVETSLEPAKPKFVSSVILKGFFTVQGEEGKHRTFRFKANKKGQTIIGLLTGSNNVTDYTWFGFVDGNIVRYWKNPRYKGELTALLVSRDEINACVNAIVGNAEEAGKRYATYYRNCSRCGKVLTTPESLERGLGPECAGLQYGGK